MNTLEDLFLDSLADMYYAENQLGKALPRIVEAVTHEDLKVAFENYLAETEGHVQKVKGVFDIFGKSPPVKAGPVIQAIISEIEAIISKNRKTLMINAALIFAVQKAEHYEIASYGGLRDWAKLLGNPRVAKMLDEILWEVKVADKKLSELAVTHCNVAAASVREEATT